MHNCYSPSAHVHFNLSGSGPQLLAPNVDVLPPERIIVGGPFNQWLNITGTVIVQGAVDPDNKIFMCTVCMDRGAPSEMCHTANYTSLLVGAPPVINEVSSELRYLHVAWLLHGAGGGAV